MSICAGNPDGHFVKIISEKKSILGKDGKISVTVDTSSDVIICGKTYSETVRVSSCQMLVLNGKCSACISYRSSLRKMYSRWKVSKKITPTRHVTTKSKTNLDI